MIFISPHAVHLAILCSGDRVLDCPLFGPRPEQLAPLRGRVEGDEVAFAVGSLARPPARLQAGVQTGPEGSNSENKGNKTKSRLVQRQKDYDH